MRIHLVAIAKNEETYIEDWMIYYFELGFDKIIIYDNNDYISKIFKNTHNDVSSKDLNTTEKFFNKDNHKNDVKQIDNKENTLKDCKNLKDFLRDSDKLESYQDRYEVIEWKGKQNVAYYEYWNKHKDEFDWLLVCDIDEFLVYKDTSSKDTSDKIQSQKVSKDIKQFLEKYNDSKILSIRCIEYGDNDLIERDMSKSAYEVFTLRACKRFESFCKTFYNSHLVKELKTSCGHYLLENNHVFRNIIPHNIICIRHLRTYSLKEYLDKKYRVKHQSIASTNNIRRYLLSLYYFKINQWTPEKQRYVEEYRKKNNIIRTLYIFKSFEQFNKYSKKFNDICVYICGNPFEKLRRAKSDFIFQGIETLRTIIYDFDNIVFIK